MVGKPTFTMSPYMFTDPQEIYPQLPFLTTREQQANYFLARNNREYIAFVRSSRQRLKGIEQHMKELDQGRMVVPQGKEISFAIDNIPDETSLLLIGENHSLGGVDSQVAQLLRSLRDKYPNRPMVLFTEFLPEGASSPFARGIDRAISLSTARNVLSIPIFGLEPAFVEKNIICEACGIDLYTLAHTQNIWTTPEGLRLRNTRWATSIKAYQQQLAREHPEWENPLTIVYAGAGHTEYGRPSSLPEMFPNEKIFSISLVSASQENEQLGLKLYNTSVFDKYIRGRFAKERVLLYKDKALAELSGSNVRLKLDPIHGAYRIDIIVNQ